MKSITPKRVTVFLLPILLFLGSASALSSREYSILSELQTTLGGVFDFSISRNEVTVPLDNQAVVSTDKLDYRPGEIVRISGDGFFPGEQVCLQVKRSLHHRHRQLQGSRYSL